jgi:beta-glucosidase-like glycosyl hydrolase
VISIRSSGADPTFVAEFTAEWIDACQAEGVLACAKHFPGHGRARGDSHLESPAVAERPDELWRSDLAPFRAAIDAGVGSVMTAHVRYPTLDVRDLPATLSRPIVTQLLREQLEFEGLIVSDSVDMRAVLALGTESDVCVSALHAGCDLLLGVADPIGSAEAIARAAQDGVLDREALRASVQRRAHWAGWGSSVGARETSLDDVMWVRQVADRSVHMARGAAPRIGQAVEVVVVDEDASGPWARPVRGEFERTLRTLEVDAPTVVEPTAHTKVPVLIALYCDVMAWKGHDAPSEAAGAAVSRALAVAARQKREACVVLFGHPRHAASITDAPRVICAWDGSSAMQAAAARALARGLLHHAR